MKKMNYKLNSKGQGALEYLLIIGGVVLVAVVVVALLIGMSSENTENSKQQSKEFIASTDLALPSTVLSVICKVKSGHDEYVVKWNPTHKEGYEYTLLFDDKPVVFPSESPVGPSVNPIVFTIASDKRFDDEPDLVPIIAECANLGSEAISIKTTNTENDTTAVSNRVFIKPQAAGTSSGPSNPSITFDTAAGTTVLSNHGITANPPAGGFYFLRVLNLSSDPIAESHKFFTASVLNALPTDLPGSDFWNARLRGGPILDAYNNNEISTIQIISNDAGVETAILTIPVSEMTIS